jgi:hypothetical protein
MLVSHLWPRAAGPGLSLVVAGVLSLGGCKKGDPEKCSQAQTVVRTAVSAGDFSSARQWRDYAYKACEDQSSLPALDQSIVDGEASAVAKKAADEKTKADTNALAKLFFEFVAQNRSAPDHAAQLPVCDPPPAGAPPAKPGAESKERLCTATRQAGTHTLEARYWDADHTAFRFTTTLDGELDCKAMGGTASKQWDVPAVGGKSAKRTRCELGGALSGLTAVVTTAGHAPLYVVSPSYLTHDPGWRVILEGP